MPDIANILCVQKSDYDENLIDRAVFGLYEAEADADGNGYYIADDGNGHTAYIRLAEDDSYGATVYPGSLDATPINGTYTINTDGSAALSTLDDDDLLGYNGYLMHLEGATANSGVITVTANGNTYYIRPAIDAKERTTVCYTHGKCSYVSEKGTAHLRFLKKGKYLLKELYAPKGFDLNFTNVEVVVGDEEVYANAGEIDDGVMVGNGAGYLVSTLNQFASIGDIAETLSYIVTTLRLHPDADTKNGFVDLTDHMNWPYVTLDRTITEDGENMALKYIFDGTEPTSANIQLASAIYLKYMGEANRNHHQSELIFFDYGVNEDGARDPANLIDSLMYWTRSGWSDLAIFQHTTFVREEDKTDPETTFTDLSVDPVTGGERDLSLIFSSSTFVRVADKTRRGLQIRKISAVGEKPLEGAKFVMYRVGEDGVKYYYTRNDSGRVIWVTLSDGTEEALSFTTDKDGLIPFLDLDDGDYYFKETVAPNGYFLSESIYHVKLDGDSVTANIVDGEAITVETPVMDELSNSWLCNVVIPNDIGYMLPATGGIGTFPYIYAGVSVMLIAGAALVIFRKRRVN